MGTPLQGRFKSGAGVVGDSSRSTFFDGSADYLHRTMGTPEDQSKWLVALWFRRTRFETAETLFQGGLSSSGSHWSIGFDSDDRLVSMDGGSSVGIITSGKYRDTEWTHLIFSYDSDDATDADRLRLWISGVEVEDFDTYAHPSTGATYDINSAADHQIGASLAGPTDNFQGGMSQILFLDGQSIQNGDRTISELGDATTVGTNGTIWKALDDEDISAYAVSAGGNSFLLSAEIGDGTDDSENGNDFTPVSMTADDNNNTDTPAAPSPVFNRLQPCGVTATISDGGRQVSLSTGAGWLALSSMVPPSGKYYLEFVADNVTSLGMAVGVCNPAVDQDGTPRATGFLHWEAGGSRYLDGVQTASDVSTWGDGDTVGLGINMDDEEVTFYNASGVADSTVGFSTDVDGTDGLLVYVGTLTGTQEATVIVKEFELSRSLPADYSTFEHGSLPVPADQGADVFHTEVYVGDGATVGAGGRSFTGYGFQPDFAWFKSRVSGGHLIFDSERGPGKFLASQSNSGEINDSETLTSFDSDGLSTAQSGLNSSGEPFVNWSWEVGGGSTTSNSDGDVTSTVQVHSSDYASIAKFTATGSSISVGHGLSDAPQLVIIKTISGTDSWYTWMNGMGGTDYVTIDSSSSSSTNSNVYSALPTTSVVNIGNIFGSGDYIMYCFRSIHGVARCGYYTGNGTTEGPFVNTGFTSAFLMIKSLGTGSWCLYDTERDKVQPLDRFLVAESTSGQQTDTREIDVLAQGFRLRTTASEVNSDSQKYFYLAMADVATGEDLPPLTGR